MSYIEKLIKQYCPNGVEYKKLWEITYWDKRFNGVDREKQNITTSFKHISSQLLKKLSTKNGNIKLLSTGNFNGFTNKQHVAEFISNEFINNGEVISIPSGGSANIKYFKGNFIDSGNILASAVDDNINLKYIYYFLININELISRP